MGAVDPCSSIQRFIIKNSPRIAAIENFLRSISYIIPGRFQDSDFTAELLYSALNLLRLAHDTTITCERKVKGEGVLQGAWNSYILFLRRRSKLMDRLLTFLNLTWTLQVPVEMLVQRIWGMSSKLRYIVVLEILKATSRLLMFVSSGLRPTLRNYIPDLGVGSKNSSTDATEELLSEIKLAGGSEVEGVRSYLRKHRTNSHILVPELSVTPAKGKKAILREISHILRPALYATAVAISLTRGSKSAGKVRWLAWAVSLCMDLFCEWPQLYSLISGEEPTATTGGKGRSFIEREEGQMRLIRMILYLLREPIYSSLSKPYLNSVYESLDKWWILRPITQSALQSCSVLLPSELQHYIQEFYALYEQRLWHELTAKVQAFFAEPKAQKAFVNLFNSFISMWHKKMNELVYIKLAIITARQLAPKDALKLLEEIMAETKQSKAPEAPALNVLATMEAAHYRLRGGDLAGTKQAIEACSNVAEILAGVDPLIPATFHRVHSDYDKANMAFAEYYRHALLYLASIKVESLSPAEAQERAHDLCVAALLSDSLYNFGELLTHPILKCLDNHPMAPLKQLLLAFNAGDHEAFEQATTFINQHPGLKEHKDGLYQKICLMSLVEAVFRQLKSSRAITLASISTATRVPQEQAEFLVMKALSLKLIRGVLCQPEGVFRIEWVQPRVLDRQQVEELLVGVGAWRRRVQETSNLVHALLPESLKHL